MTLVLHGYRYSVYNRIARLALAEKGVAYDRVEVNPFAADRPAAYLALHPFSRVPALVHDGPLGELLSDLADRGVIQVLVEGGAHVAWSFFEQGWVDQFVIYYAPALLGGDDGVPLFAGRGAATMADAWRGRIASVRTLGPDIRIDVLAAAGEPAVP